MKSNSIQKIKSITGPNSVQSFQKEHLFQDQPCVIQNEIESWTALKKWNAHYLSEKFGNIHLPISNYKSQGNIKPSLKQKMSIRDYFSYIEQTENGKDEIQEPLYAAGWHYLKDCAELASDLGVPEHFSDNWIDRLKGIINFDQTSLFIGHRKAETPLHTDSFFVSTWLAMVQGEKILRLIPGQYSGYVKNGLDTFDAKVIDELSKQEIPLYEAKIKTGDIIYIPPGWWHQVKNESVTIAVSNNYVSSYHFLNFEQQLRAKLLKPLVNLNKLRDDAILTSAESLTNLQKFRYSIPTTRSSKFIENERDYAKYLVQESNKISYLLDFMESRSFS